MTIARRTIAALCVIALNSANQAQTPMSYGATEPSTAQPLAIGADRGAAALWQSLKRLRTRASLLMITAHPDDEDGALLALESRGAGTRAALLTLNRGEGGANVMSSAFNEPLGLLRTEEQLAADSYYGVEQFWTSVVDYGYSKAVDEAFAKWGKERVLADVVRVVRTVRPLVIVSPFTGTPADGHGQHQAAGQLAKEAMEAAGDPNRFPEQLQQGLRPWKPLKLYVRAAQPPAVGKRDPGMVEIPVTDYDAMLGMSYLQLSRLGLGQHKSQNGGPDVPFAGRGSQWYRCAAAPAAPKKPERSFFEDVDISLAGISAFARQPGRSFLPDAISFLPEGLRGVTADIEEATANFTAAQPERSAPALADGYKQVVDLLGRVEKSAIADDAKDRIAFELRMKAAQFNEALEHALALTLRAEVVDDHAQAAASGPAAAVAGTALVVPGQTVAVNLTVANQSSEAVELTALRLEAADAQSWQLEPVQPARGPLEAGAIASARFRASVAPSAAPTRPYFTRPNESQAFYEPADPHATLRSRTPYPLHAVAEFRYNGATLHMQANVLSARRVLGAGTLYDPLMIAPAVSLVIDPGASVVPLAAKSFPVRVSVRNNSLQRQEGAVQLELPENWRCDPAAAAFSIRDRGASADLHFKITPAAVSAEPYAISALARTDQQEFREGFRLVTYPPLRPAFYYHAARAVFSGADLRFAPGLRVAYIEGSGDEVAPALATVGIRVHHLSPVDIAEADLSQYDVILVGVRAYASRPELAEHNARLLSYVHDGGVMIVQYNTPEFDHNYGPYPYKMGSQPEEVTDEQSGVELLEPDHPVLAAPNRITQDDFAGWVEERGSKFLTSWDPRYTALLSTADPNQAEQRGGLLYARYGRGVYVYCAYALYRQLPAGVPGAYRLMANLLSLPRTVVQAQGEGATRARTRRGASGAVQRRPGRQKPRNPENARPKP